MVAKSERVVNPNYKITISCEGVLQNPIIASLPKGLALTLASEWSRMFGADSTSATLSGVIQYYSNGYTTANKYLSAQVFTGNTPLTLTIPFELRAFSDARTEVMQVIKDLSRLSLPSSDNPMRQIKAPPSPITGHNITVRLGNFAFFEKVIINRVETEFGPQLSREGYPLQCSCTMTMTTFYQLTTFDIDTALVT